VKITPGPRFLVAGAAIAWVGAAPDAKAQAAAKVALHLKDGEPGRAAEVVGAEGRVVSAVQRLGYADAQTEPREVVVDHADRTVRPTFKIRAGDLVRLDGMDLTTDGRNPPRPGCKVSRPGRAAMSTIPKTSPNWSGGCSTPASTTASRFALAPIEKKTAEGLRPIVVSLAERKRRTIELGASYATSEGLGLDSKWIHYNVLARADTLALVGRLSGIDSRLGVDLTLPHWLRPQADPEDQHRLLPQPDGRL